MIPLVALIFLFDLRPSLLYVKPPPPPPSPRPSGGGGGLTCLFKALNFIFIALELLEKETNRTRLKSSLSFNKIMFLFY